MFSRISLSFKYLFSSKVKVKEEKNEEKNEEKVELLQQEKTWEIIDNKSINSLKTNLVENNVVKFNKYKIDPEKINSSYYDLFNNSFKLVKNKWMYVFVTIFCSLTPFLSIYALYSRNYILFLGEKIFKNIINYGTRNFYRQILFDSRNKWKNIIMCYFHELPHIPRVKTNMNDFENQVNKTSWTFGRTINHIIPNLVELIFDCLSTLFAIVMYFVFDSSKNENVWIKGIILMFLLFCVPLLYYFLMIKNKQQNLGSIRIKRQIMTREIVPVSKWILYLFQGKKRTYNEISEIDNQLDLIDMKFELGWGNIASEFIFVCTCVVLFVVWLLSLNSDWIIDVDNGGWELLLKNLAIFGKVIGTISMFSHTSTALETHIKDFDSLIEWIQRSGKRELDVPQKRIDFPLNISKVDIRLEGYKEKKFILNSSNDLNINHDSVILLKGPSGVGKTQLVNSLQGLVNGVSFFSEYSSKNYWSSWEYLDQQTRENIPSRGLSLRRMLEDETDDSAIWKYIRIVKLEDKFDSLGLNEPMENLSGGEKMRLSLLYTIWDLIKRDKQVLILDEPEQGLDEDTRVDVIKNIMNFLIPLKIPCLVIYHGSRLDLMQLPFKTVWLFDKQDEMSVVEEREFDVYRQELKKEILSVLA